MKPGEGYEPFASEVLDRLFEIIVNHPIDDPICILPAPVPGRANAHGEWIVLFDEFVDRTVELAERVDEGVYRHLEFFFEKGFGADDF